MLIKACLNGSRESGALDALPLSPSELARAARKAVEAGAGALIGSPELKLIERIGTLVIALIHA